MTQAEIQNAFERELAGPVEALVGRGPQEDWALVRALVHKAVHLAAERRADFCAVATLLAEMTQHAHEIMHTQSSSHGTLPH